MVCVDATEINLLIGVNYRFFFEYMGIKDPILALYFSIWIPYNVAKFLKACLDGIGSAEDFVFGEQYTSVKLYN